MRSTGNARPECHNKPAYKMTNSLVILPYLLIFCFSKISSINFAP